MKKTNRKNKNENCMENNNSIITKAQIFVKAQFSAFLGATSDYLIMILLTEFLGVYYMVSITIGCVVGSVINFSINKLWAFRSKDLAYRRSLIQQLWRFGFVVVSGILLKLSGTWLITTFVFENESYYWISRLIADGIVSACYTFTMQHYWVFAKNTTEYDDESA